VLETTHWLSQKYLVISKSQSSFTWTPYSFKVVSLMTISLFKSQTIFHTVRIKYPKELRYNVCHDGFISRRHVGRVRTSILSSNSAYSSQALVPIVELVCASGSLPPCSALKET
jgi:hypothetical protein